VDGAARRIGAGAGQVRSVADETPGPWARRTALGGVVATMIGKRYQVGMVKNRRARIVVEIRHLLCLPRRGRATLRWQEGRLWEALRS